MGCGVGGIQCREGALEGLQGEIRNQWEASLGHAGEYREGRFLGGYEVTQEDFSSIGEYGA